MASSLSNCDVVSLLVHTVVVLQHTRHNHSVVYHVIIVFWEVFEIFYLVPILYGRPLLV